MDLELIVNPFISKRPGIPKINQVRYKYVVIIV